MDNDKTIATLNTLTEISYDGQKGFANAAQHAKRADLKTLFAEYAAACESGLRELSEHVRTLGGTPKEGGTIGGAFRRGLTDVRVSTSSHSDQAILEECEKGEDVAKKAYADALKENLPPDIRALIESQNANVIAHHDTVRDLRDMRVASV
jgi:uncharacterized protein (TIGR02284 family)